MSQRWRRRIYVLLFLSAAFLLGSKAQHQLGIAFTVDGLQAFRNWVENLGWFGPAVFILLVIFRLFIGLSSHLVLILGGLAFGVVGGVIWGSLGVLASALVLYCLAQLLGADWVHRRFGDDYKVMLERIQRIGAIAIFAITAHPLGLLTPAHLAAGLIGLSFIQFAVTVALAAPIRALPYAVLGTAILDMTLAQSMVIAGILLAAFFVPMFIPRVREWVWVRPDS